MKRIIAVILVILCLCGCDMKRIRTESSIKEYETDFSTVYAETVKFSGMKNSEFEKNINAQIQQSIDSDLVAFDSKAQECKDNLQMGNKCVMEIGWEETYNKNDFISVVEEKYIYTGGARGTTVHIPVNIDVSGEKEVKLADLFADDGYVSTLNRMINEEMEKHSEEYKDLWAKPEIKQEIRQDFYIQDR